MRHVKKVIVTMAALLILLQQPIWAADNKVESVTTQSEQVSESRSKDLKVTSHDIPKGASISSEQAWQKLISVFPLLSGATVNSAEYGKTNSYPAGYTQVWNLDLSYKTSNSTSGFSATVDGVSGEVLSVYLPTIILERLGKTSNKLVNDKEAEAIAKQWLSAHLKSTDYAGLHEVTYYMNTQTPSLFAPEGYNFFYTIWVNDLPSDIETINISVSRSGEVLSYNRSKTPAKYPSATPTLSQSEIDKKYNDSFDVTLAYLPESLYSTSSQQKKYFLGYTPLESNGYSLDANTGKPLDNLNGDIEQLSLLDKKIDLPQSGGKYIPSSKSVSADDAVTLITSKIGVPKEYIIQSEQTQSKWDDPKTKVWSLHWKHTNNSMYSDVSAEVNVKTGQVYRYNNSIIYGSQGEIPSYPASGPTLTDNQLQQKAIKLVTSLVSNAPDEYKLAYISTPNAKVKQPTYTYRFLRYTDGIAISNDQVQVVLKADGSVQNFNVEESADLTTLPQNSKPMISKEEARNLYLSKLKLQLKYSHLGGMWSGNAEIPDSIKLVYAPGWSESTLGNVWLDAQSGKWRTTYYGPVSTTTTEAKDIQNHPSEKSLVEILKHGILIPDEQGNIQPDAAIKTGDWMNMSARAVYPSLDSMNRGGSETLQGGLTSESPYYNALQSFIELGWMDYNANTTLTSTLDKVLTRDELAVSLVSILQYEKLSHYYTELSDVPGVSDASAISHKGAVAIAMKLGLLPAVDGKFLPDRPVTRAEASEVLLRLADLIGKTDRFMNQNSRY
jgi:hypothetical protein